MTDNTNPPVGTSDLNPSAPAFTMPSDDNKSSVPAAAPETKPNGEPKASKQSKRPEPRTATTAENIAEAGAGVKLSGAQLKKQKQAEKAARRAGKVAERGEQTQAQAQTSSRQGPVQAREQQERQRRMSNNAAAAGDEGQPQHHRRSGSTTVRLPVRGNAQQGATQGDRTTNTHAQEKVLDKRVPMLAHLYTASSGQGGRRLGLVTADRQIHPSVLTLGLQIRDYTICGSNARTVATLLVFKKVIQSYDTPSGVALSRDLTRHLSHQISYLSHARPLCVGQGNSIRWLKKLITSLDPDLADTDAKQFLCRAIDTFVSEKITLADEVIATQAGARLEDEGEVILTFGKSSVVEKTLVMASEAGKKFKVIVVDSGPLFEGENMARNLVRAGLPEVQYCLLNSLADVVDRDSVTKCLLGASAMLGNGKLSSRAGSATVAMMAKESSGALGKGKIPVIVLCESVKFTARIALDSIAMNEIADPDTLLRRDDPDTLTATVAAKPDPPKKPAKGGGGASRGGANDDDTEKKDHSGLDGWKDRAGLYLLNLMYDVTPVEYLDLVISELGSLPPNAVPVVNGVHGDDD